MAFLPCFDANFYSFFWMRWRFPHKYPMIFPTHDSQMINCSCLVVKDSVVKSLQSRSIMIASRDRKIIRNHFPPICAGLDRSCFRRFQEHVVLKTNTPRYWEDTRKMLMKCKCGKVIKGHNDVWFTCDMYINILLHIYIWMNEVHQLLFFSSCLRIFTLHVLPLFLICR